MAVTIRIDITMIKPAPILRGIDDFPLEVSKAIEICIYGKLTVSFLDYCQMISLFIKRRYITEFWHAILHVAVKGKVS